MTIKKGRSEFHKFSPTGFYSSAVKNNFLLELEERSQRQTPYLKEQTNEFNEKIEIGPRKRTFYVKNCDKTKILEWIKKGFFKTNDYTQQHINMGYYKKSKSNC